jgi:tRNA G18 (ribose-2'-O)-methylase SpoU
VALEALLPSLKPHFSLVGSDPLQGSLPHPCGPATALLLGSESHGLAAQLLAATDERWRIPGAGRNP